MQPNSPNLSEIAHQILALNPEGYRRLSLAGVAGNPQAYALLSATDPSKLIVNPVKDERMLRAVECGLWLWNDYLDEAHKLAKAIDTDTGAFWHAIVHRLEGDYDNARHWYARCMGHPVRLALTNQSAILLNDLPADNRLIKLTFNGWNSDYLVELAQQFAGRPDDEFYKVLVVLQQLEWRVLLEYCAALA